MFAAKSRIFRRLCAAWHAFKHSACPAYAVIYDFPIVDGLGKPTGDFEENFYEAFSDTNEAYELFRTAYRKDDRVPVKNPRLVLILDSIDSYHRPRRELMGN